MARGSLLFSLVTTIRTRQTGSDIRLTSKVKGTEHHVTVPVHRDLRVGTLHTILRDVASYLDKDFARLVEELFG
jgi:hypothetical protein